LRIAGFKPKSSSRSISGGKSGWFLGGGHNGEDQNREALHRKRLLSLDSRRFAENSASRRVANPPQAASLHHMSGGGFEVFAVAGVVDLGFCKNEAILLWAFFLIHFRDVQDGVQVPELLEMMFFAVRGRQGLGEMVSPWRRAFWGRSIVASWLDFGLMMTFPVLSIRT
jgi:hypothetical protein